MIDPNEEVDIQTEIDSGLVVDDELPQGDRGDRAPITNPLSEPDAVSVLKTQSQKLQAVAQAKQTARKAAKAAQHEKTIETIEGLTAEVRRTRAVLLKSLKSPIDEASTLFIEMYKDADADKQFLSMSVLELEAKCR